MANGGIRHSIRHSSFAIFVIRPFVIFSIQHSPFGIDADSRQ